MLLKEPLRSPQAHKYEVFLPVLSSVKTRKESAEAGGENRSEWKRDAEH